MDLIEQIVPCLRSFVQILCHICYATEFIDCHRSGRLRGGSAWCTQDVARGGECYCRLLIFSKLEIQITERKIGAVVVSRSVTWTVPELTARSSTNLLLYGKYLSYFERLLQMVDPCRSGWSFSADYA